ncbi:FkbM family methyltransferase [Neobacillus sp. NPDC093127]|uniref:FkbM family methyltransferase n=1 Tax=Neobacillus sp. NPDC093127 TaxID=3364296 RepID=UPI00380B1239
MLVILKSGGKIHALADDLSITTGLLIDGYFELSLSHYILRNIREGMNVVDVGANIGYFSVMLGFKVGETGKVTAYEPNDKVYQLLLDNLTLNEHKQNAVVKKLGIYSENTKLTFYVSDRFQGNSSIKQHSDEYKNDFKSDEIHSNTIDTVALDNENLGHIDFLKIDTEGGEYHVFKGMKNILDNKQVDTVVFELNKSMLQDDVQPFYELLKSYEGDYHYHLLTPLGDLIGTDIDTIYRKAYIDNIVMKKG